MRWPEAARRTFGCLGSAVLGLAGAVGVLLAAGIVQQRVRPGFDTPVVGVAVAALLAAAGLASLLVLSRRR